MQLAVADLLAILGVGQSAIDDHRGPFAQPDSGFEQIEHPAQCRTVLGIAREDLVRDGKTFATNDQSDHHLLAIGAMVAGIATLGFGIAQCLSLEIGAGQVVEVDGGIERKQLPFPLDQVRLEGGPVGMEPVEIAVEGIVDQGGEIHAQDIRQRGGANPTGHSVLAVRVDQPVHGHGTGELNGPWGEAVTLEDRVESQPLPELEANVEGPCGAWLGHGDGVGMDRDEIGWAGLGKRTGRRLGGVSLASSDLADDLLDFRIRT